MRTDRGALGQGSSACSSSVEDAAGGAGQQGGVGPAARAPARPASRAGQTVVAEGGHLGAAGRLAGLGVGGRAAGRPPSAGGRPRRPASPAAPGRRRSAAAAGRPPRGPAAQVVDVALEPLDRHPVEAAGQRHLEGVLRLADLAPQRPAEHLRHAGIALEHGDLGRVDRPHRHPRGQVGHRGLRRRRPRRGWAAPARCSAGTPGSARRRARRCGPAGRGACRAGRRRGAARPPSCRCPARPARRSTRPAAPGRCRPARAGWWRRCRASARCAAARSRPAAAR